MGKIYEPTVMYSLLRVYTNFIFKRWFSSVEVNGESNIPENTSVIFAPNHQNALIDAMALLSSVSSPVVLLARADLFKKKAQDKALRSLRIMPAYRIRDGIQNLKKNEDSFEQSIEVLLHKNFLCLMPEGGQDEHRRLRHLVKGMFRIAFSTQEMLPENDYVKIVPVGLDYGNYDHSGSHLVVNFGKPISIKDYWESYKENAPVAQNRLRDELYNRMAPLMLNIQSEAHYDAFYVSSYLYNERMLDELCVDDNESNRLIARQRIVEHLQKKEEDGDASLSELDTLCGEWLKTHPDVAFSSKAYEDGIRLDSALLLHVAYLVVTSPLVLYSLLFNGIPFAIVKRLAAKSKGSGFESSFVFGAAGLLFPMFYVVYAVVSAFFVPSLSFWVAFLFTLPMSFCFFIRYRWRCQYVKERISNIFRKRDVVPDIRKCLDRLFGNDQ